MFNQALSECFFFFLALIASCLVNCFDLLLESVKLCV